MNVFFSLLAVLIVIMLYVLFLGDVVNDELVKQLKISSKSVDATVTSLMLSGMIGMAAVTTSLGALSVSVSDQVKASKDFLTTPIRRGKISLSYVFASSISGLILTFVSFFICIGFILLKGGIVPGFTDWLLLIFTTILSVLCGNSIIYFITLFVKSSNAFAPLSTVIGTMLGFIMGIYMPIGTLPAGVQWVVKTFPMSHSASMFKQILADPNLEKTFENAPASELEAFRELYGVTFHYGNFESSFWFSALVLAATTLIFYTLSVFIVKKTIRYGN
jgi:multidrug/hemolysin transport system permease protein